MALDLPFDWKLWALDAKEGDLDKRHLALKIRPGRNKDEAEAPKNQETSRNPSLLSQIDYATLLKAEPPQWHRIRLLLFAFLTLWLAAPFLLVPCELPILGFIAPARSGRMEPW